MLRTDLGQHSGTNILIKPIHLMNPAIEFQARVCRG